MLRKTLALTVLAALMLSLLAGCGGTKNAPAEKKDTAAPAAPKEPVKLRIWGGVPEDRGPLELVENWNKANPDIQVEYVRFVNDDAGNTKLETALLAGSDVDLYMTYSIANMSKRVEAGMALALDDLIKQNKMDVAGLGQYPAWFDKSYMLPTKIEPSVIWINKKAFDDAKIPVPTDWTWDEFADIAKKLTKEGNPKKYGAYLHYTNDWMQLVNTVKGPNANYNAKGESNFDDPAFKQALQWRINLEKAGAIPSAVEVKSGKLTWEGMFMTGRAAMMPQAAFFLRYVTDTKTYPRDFMVTFAPIPKLTKDQKEVFDSGAGYGDFISINPKTKHKDAAFKFLNWYVTEGMMPLAKFGRIPLHKNMVSDNLVKMLAGEDAAKVMDVEAFKKYVLGQRRYATPTKYTAAAEIDKIMQEETEKVSAGSQTVDQAIANLKRRSDQAIKDAK